MTKKHFSEIEALSDSDSELAMQALTLLEKYRKLEARYTALFTLNHLSKDCADLNTFFAQVHQAIASIMKAQNFYIVMYDQTFETLEFVYHVDENDDFPDGPIAFEDFKGSMTCHVIEQGKPLLVTPEKMHKLKKDGTIKQIGTVGTDWLGVPLLSDGFVIGVMAVQSYSETTRYQDDDLEMLTFTAQHIVTAMTRLQDRERLQKAVDARTRELMQQIREREKSELLQESLYRISELTNDASIDINRFYEMVHNIVGQLINAENFYIAKHNKSQNIVSFAYYSEQDDDEVERKFKPRSFGKGYTELVISKKETVLLSQEDMLSLHQQGKTVKPQDKNTILVRCTTDSVR